MSKYLRKFETEAEYSAATIYRPSVSLILDSMDVKFDPIQPTPPALKYKLTLSDSSVVSAACDGTSAVTSGEVSPYSSTLVAAEIGDCVTSIGNDTFSYCNSLSSITVPDSVTSIGEGAFGACYSLTSIVVDSNNTVYDSRNNCNAIIETSTNKLIQGCNSTLIPSGVTSIGETAFSQCRSLTSITIPNSVTSIGDYAFYNCSGLTSVTIPNSVTSIGASAFRNCSGFTSITVNATTPPVLGNYAFQGSTCAIYVPNVEAYKSASGWSTYASRIQAIPTPGFEGKYKLTLNDSTTVSAACDGTSAITSAETTAYTSTLVSAEIGDCVSIIGDLAFDSCYYLTSIDIPSGVTTIGDLAFHYCYSLTSVDIPDSVTTIGDYAFSSCISLTSCTIGTGVTSISSNAFGICEGLSAITIPNSVTTIGAFAFSQCRSLTSIDIPNSVTSIGAYAFGSCSSLASVTVNATTPPTLDSNVFDGSTCPIYVPAASVETYKSAANWSTYASRIQAIS